MNWLLLSLLSALLLGFYEVSKKASVDGNAVIPVLFASSASGLVLLVPVILLSHYAPAAAARWGLALAPLSGAGHLLVFAKAIIVTLSWVLTYFALKHLPISLASPVRASAPLFTLVGALILFRERPSSTQWLGIACTLAAYWGFSLIGRMEGIRFERNRWIWYLFAGTLVGAASGLYDKHLLQAAHIAPMALQLWFTVYACLIQGIILVVAWWPRHHRTTPFTFRATIVLVALLLILADAVYFRALSTPGALVSIVATIRRSNVVISFAVGGFAFQERFRRRKALALVGILAGLALLMK
jgi:bacterial/archaeal transporter family protein